MKVRADCPMCACAANTSEREKIKPAQQLYYYAMSVQCPLPAHHRQHSISTAHTNDLIRSAQCKRWMARNLAPKWRGSCSLRIISFNWVEHLLHYLETIDGRLSSCIIDWKLQPERVAQWLFIDRMKKLRLVCVCWAIEWVLNCSSLYFYLIHYAGAPWHYIQFVEL